MHATARHLQSHETPEADELGASVARQLSRSYHNLFSISPLRATVLGVVTLGVAPLLRMRRQFHEFVRFERQQLWYFAEYLRTRGHEEANAIADASRTICYRRSLHWLQNACIVGVIAVFWYFLRDSSFDLDRILNRTLRFVFDPRRWEIASMFIPFLAWNAGLAAAYGLHALQVRQHRRAMAKTLAKLPPVRTPPVDLDMNWPAPAILLLCVGGVWGIMMSIAGATQRRYINITSAANRGAMLQRVNQVHPSPLPTRRIANYTLHLRRCGNGLCQATLPQEANFCPRCGTRAGAMAQTA